MRTLRVGEDVLDPQGERLGRVERIVVDTHGRRVTHLVVQGRAVPAERFRDAGPDGLATDLDSAGLEGMADAGEMPFAAPGENWEAPAGYGLEQFLRLLDTAAQQISGAPVRLPVHVDMGSEALHEITRGSPVWSGSEHLGEVERVLTDDAGALEAIVVASGLLRRRRQVAAGSVREVAGNNIHLDLTRDSFEALPDYEG